MLNHQVFKYEIKVSSNDNLKDKSLEIQTHPHVPSRTLPKKKGLV